MEDKLARIWEEQQQYNGQVKKLQDRSQVEWIQTYLLGVVSEGGDLLDAFSWKRHRPSQDLTEANRQNMLTEVGDMFKYVMCLAQAAGIELQQLLDEVDSKGKFLQFQLQGDFTELPEGRPLLVCDLDGTVADFRISFSEFVERQIPEFEAARLASSPTIHMDIAGSIGFDAYHALKSQWEAGGGYGLLPPLGNMVENLLELQRTHSLVFFTARPTGLKRVRQDTWRWLMAQELRPDRLFFSKFERIVWCASMRGKDFKVILLDDDPEILERAVSTGIPTVAVRHSYNAGVIKAFNIPFVDPWGGQEELSGQIQRAQEAG